MYSIDLIGKVATKFLRESLNLEDSDGVARFLLDRLTGEQVANICQAILATPDLSSCIKIQIPRTLVEGYDLPEAILTMDSRYQHFREKKVNNLFAYNQKVAAQEKLPVLLLVHDEFADWMLVGEYKSAVSSAVQR